MAVYEHLLNDAPEIALEEGSMHFEERSAVHVSLRRLAERLDRAGIPYALAGAMGLFLHGYRRFTEDVDVLVKKEDLARIHEALIGLGYRPLFAGSKNVRDVESGVRIEFLLSGEFPGDGKPKPVAFPAPADASTVINGLKCVRLDKMIELKLASGMTNPGRLKDLADVQETIRVLGLPRDFSQRLDPYVREKYGELWAAVQDTSPEE
jgi:hypothetical protein